MVTLQNHVLSILAKSAESASEDIIKLFDSSFEAFSEELRKRHDEINALRRKLEESEPKSMGPNGSGPAFLCVQCGVSLNCVIPIEENPKEHNTDNESPQNIGTDFRDHQPLVHVPIIESETEEDFEFEVGAEEDSSYSDLIQEDKNTDCTETVQQEEPTTHKVESNPLIFPQKRGRGRPKKQQVVSVYVPPKRGRGRPRKTEVVVTLKSQPNMFLVPEQPKKAQIQKEIVSKPEPVQPIPPQTSITHSMSKKETGPKVQLQLTRAGRRGRGRPPKRLLDPLLIPFAGTKSILSGPKNHECEPVALTNKFEDEFPPKTVEPVPKPEEPVPIPEKTLPMTEEPVALDNSEKALPYNPITQPKKGKVLLKCPKCPRQYPRKSMVQAHMKSHRRKGESACHICGLTFIGTSQMTNHMRVHTGEKPYSCNVCLRRFPNQSQYNKHLLCHTAPDYACEVCGLKSSQVRKTLRKAHLRSKEPCSNCASIYT